MDKNTFEELFQSKSYISDWGKYLEDTANQQCRKEQNDLILKDIESIFRVIFKSSVNVITYGSRETGLTIKDNSDIDLLIDSSNNNVIKVTCEVTENWVLDKANKYIKNECSNKWKNIQVIFTCRTPVLKMTHIETNRHCDITVKGFLGVANTRMMLLYIKHTPYLRQAILAVREWALFCGLNQYLHNYTLSLLVLFYFQIEMYAVAVKDLMFESDGIEIDVSGYEYVNFDTIDYTKFSVKNAFSTNLHEILQGFFDFYSNFDYEEDVVCPLLGHTIKKKLFDMKYLKKLPAEMHIYVQNIKKGYTRFDTSLPICVQDPLDLCHNLIKVKKKHFDKTFHSICNETANVLRNLKA